MIVASLKEGSRIRSLEFLASIRKIEAEFRNRNGFDLENVSYWNPKDFYARELSSFSSSLADVSELTDYVYTSNIQHHADFIRRIEGQPNRSCIFTGSGTASSANVAAYLKNAGYKHIAIIQPSYFAFAELCHFAGIQVTYFDICREGGQYRLPDIRDLLSKGVDSLFLTNPVYGTGVYLDAIASNWLQEAMEHGLAAVIDESLAIHGQHLVERMGNCENALGIYVPHKALCLNNFRFSAVTFPARHATYFEQWTDIFDGGLSYSSAQSIDHFCSEDFSSVKCQVDNILERQAALFSRIVDAFPMIEKDDGALGHLRQVYAPGVAYEKQLDTRFLETVFFEAAASFIPAARFGYAKSGSFSFRVNLFRLDEATAGALHRLLRALSSQSL